PARTDPPSLPPSARPRLAPPGAAPPRRLPVPPGTAARLPRPGWGGTHTTVRRHLMGKKSTGDFPYVYEEENKTPFSALPENIKQLEDYLQWEEISKYLLRLLEGNENKSAHFLKGGLPWYTRNTWETDYNGSWKDVSKIKPVKALHMFKFRFTASSSLWIVQKSSRNASRALVIQ
uniref:Gastrin-releasing peptide n=1 Tax=Strix occidentalis caurina TaxID=311401 RepID=A0A8D0FKR3_STROC